MRLNRLGRLTMNNPARERLLLGYVGSRLETLDSASAGRTLVIGCGQGTDIEMALGRFHATSSQSTSTRTRSSALDAGSASGQGSASRSATSSP